MKIPLKMQKEKFFSSCRQLAWLFALVMSVQALSAQTKTVTGTVYDAAGETLPGANISVVGTSTGTMTDLDGKFTIQAAEGATLRISFTGMISQTVKVGAKTPLTITLKEDQKLLDEVVVTALGITREAKSLSYSRQGIDTESMSDARASNMLDMLSGKAAGMQVIPGGGPLASTRIVIRGNNSLTGNNQPLFVIDGIPILNDMGESGDLDYGNPANSINPDEIENIEVLKGANAAALYGSDAANGVVLITTKKASKKPGLGIGYSFNMMFGTLYNYPTYQNIYGAGQNGRFERDGSKNVFGMNANGWVYNPDLPYGIWVPASANQDQRSWGMPMLGFDIVGRNGEVRAYSPQPDNVRRMFRSSTAITNSLSVDKVSDMASIRFSYTNIHSDDIIDGFNNLDRHNFNLRGTAKLAPFIELDANVRYMNENVDNRNGRGDSNINTFRNIMQLPRDVTPDELIPWKRSDGTAYMYRGFINPYWVMNEISNADEKQNFMGNVTFNIKLPYNLSLRLRGSQEINSTQGWKFVNKGAVIYDGTDDGDYQRWSQNQRNTNGDILLSYNQRFGQNISLNANAGASIQNTHTDRMDARVTILKFYDLKSLSNVDGTSYSASEGDSGKEKQGVFGMASFGYGDWIYIEATARNEWSSALPAENRSYFYWSLGSSLVFSDLLNIDKEALSFGKLRISYAEVGNDTGFDRLLSGYNKNSTSYLGESYYTGETSRNNPRLKPEMTKSFETGADLRFLNNRLSVDLTYYQTRTIDQILSAASAWGSGFENEVVNSGEVRNRGYEASVSYTPIKNNSLSWTTTLNWSKNVSKVAYLPDGLERIQLNSGTNLQSYAVAGQPYATFWGNDYKRDSEGRLLAQNIDGRTAYLTNQYLGTIEPDWFGGWKNVVRFGSFDFGMMVDFQYGGNVWSQTAYLGGVDGNTVQSLEGRLEYLYSDMVLRESAAERLGFLEAANTVRGNSDYSLNPSGAVLYPDWQRPKGVQMDNLYYDSNVDYFGQQIDEYGNPIPINVYAWVSPMVHWVHNNQSSAARYIFDASYVKLRELSFGYNVPAKWLKGTPIRSARLSAVGRNLAIIYQGTPKGMDPQATSTTGNGQGFEKGFNLPQANYGFDIKVTF
jgi:TonB-linked SusC/RagA family outer membrane protein